MSREAEHPGNERLLVPRTSERALPRRNRRRSIALFGLFTALAATAVVVRGQEMREWWLERLPDERLQSRAAATEADSLTLLVAGRRQLRQGRAEEALETLIRAEKALPYGARGRVAQRINSLAGYLLARSGDTEHAVPYLTRAREMDDDDALAHLGIGIVFASRGMPRFAVSQFELAAQLDPRNVEAWYRLGKAAIENQKAQQAIDPLKRAIALAPNDAASHAELGIAYAIQSQFSQAVPAFRKALELAPEQEEYRALLANALAMNARSEQEYREAAAMLDSVLESRSDDSLLFTLGLLHLRFNQLELARKSLKRCLALAPQHASAWYNLSVVAQRMGDEKEYEAARRRFERITDIHTQTVTLEKEVAARPSDPALRRKLARAYKSGGNLTGAYWQLRTASQLAPEDRAVRRELEAVARNSPAAGTSATLIPGSENSPGPPPPPELLRALSRGVERAEAPER